MQNRPLITIGGYISRAQYQYTLQDVDLDELYSSSTKADRGAAKKSDLCRREQRSRSFDPVDRSAIDRDRAAALGITPQQIETALGASFGGTQIAPIYTQADQYWVNSGIVAAISAGSRCH